MNVAKMAESDRNIESRVVEAFQKTAWRICCIRFLDKLRQQDKMMINTSLVIIILFIGCWNVAVSALNQHFQDESRRLDNSFPLVNMTVITGAKTGSVIMKIHPDWAPLGSERFVALVKESFYDNCKFFRVIKVPFLQLCSYLFIIFHSFVGIYGSSRNCW